MSEIRVSLLKGRKALIYLTAGAEVLSLGVHTLVVVDIVLPAVLGPGRKTSKVSCDLWVMIQDGDALILLRETGIEAYNRIVKMLVVRYLSPDREKPARANFAGTGLFIRNSSGRTNVPAIGRELANVTISSQLTLLGRRGGGGLGQLTSDELEGLNLNRLIGVDFWNGTHFDGVELFL